MHSLPCSLLLLFTLSALLIFLSLPCSALPSCSPSDLISLQGFQSSISTLLPWTNHTNCCSWLGVGCNAQGHVVSLHLPSSNLSGSISPLLFQLSALHSLNLSKNSLCGDVAPGIANLSMLTSLDLSHNPFLMSPIPLQLPSSLQYLDLSHCAFHGSIIINASSSLKEVFIGDNFFSLFVSASMEALQTFDAPRNFFTTSILQTLQNCTNLRVLNLNRNDVGGTIPSEIGMLSNLEVVRLQGNGITGFIPQEIGDCKQMREIWLDDNHLTGTLPKELGKLSLLTHLSLSNNRLYGSVPDAIVGCAQLSHLSLSGNMFTGKIPAPLGGLPNLEVLLMANNKLSGFMPWEIGWLGRLRILDVARNRVEGSISSGTLDAIMDMCGYHKSAVYGAPSCCDGVFHTSQDKPYHHHHHHHRRLLQTTHNKSQAMPPLITGIISGIGVFCAIVLVAVVVGLCGMKINPWHRMRRRPNPPPRLPSLRRFRCESSQVFDPSLTSISMRDLIKATSDFNPERVIGDGGFGLVYRATLCDGRTVAVKKLATDGIQGKREFQAELETLGRIKHRNLVELLAFCKVGEDRALVYEFMENGSLDTWLHEKEDGPRLLDWKMRLHIAIGAARGLAYLHHKCNPHVIHRDIKSSNILLGKDFEARIADFGLARHMSKGLSHVSTDAAGTLGYMAPEYYSTLCATIKADVYSFGMLMLELASGRRPDSVLEEKSFKSLTTWVHHVVECGREMDLLDPVLKEKAAPPHDQVRGYITLAHACVSQLPEDRPTMKEVYVQLSQLKVQSVDGENVDKSSELQNGGMEDSKDITSSDKDIA